MSEGKADCRPLFMTWLLHIAPANQLSELHIAFHNIEFQAKKAGIVQNSLYEDISVSNVRKIKENIEQSKIFKYMNKRQMQQISSALNYLLQYALLGEHTVEAYGNGLCPSSLLHSTFPTADSDTPSKVENSIGVGRETLGTVQRVEESEIVKAVNFYDVESETFLRPTTCTSEEKVIEPSGDSAGCPQVGGRYYRKDKEEFYLWMREDQHMAEVSCRNYVSAIRGAERFAEEHGLSLKNLYKSDADEARATADALFSDVDFIQYDNEQHNRFRSAITKFLAFKGCDWSPPVQNYRKDQEAFYLWMKEKQHMAEASCRNYVSAIKGAEKFAEEHNFTSWRLYTADRDVARATIALLLEDKDFLAYNATQHNRFSVALSKFKLFIDADSTDVSSGCDAQKGQQGSRIEEYVSVLKEHFKKGFRMESPLEIRKFRRYYSAVNGNELKDSDDQISHNISKMCLLYDGKAFLPDIMLSGDLKKSLLSYIDESFKSGKQVIYFQALYNEFAEAFLDYHIHDADMLKAYLMHLHLKDVFFNRSFISREANAEIDPASEIRSCLQEHAQPMEYEELFSALPHLPQRKIKFILANNGEFINNGQGQYFHESSVILSDEELEDIVAIIDYAIENKEFIGGNELYDAIRAKYPYIIENNSVYSVYGFRDALKYKLGNRFSFKGNIISRIGQELSMADVFANYAKRHSSFTLTELQSLAGELATVIYFEAVYEKSLRISKEQFVSKDQAQFSVSETDAAIDRICTGNYISLQEITNFGAFPYAGFPWNSFLLEHYVAEFSHKYRLLHSSYNSTECAGAIVKREAGLETFDDFIVDFLANSHIELSRASALRLLSAGGYLARSRYSNIESLIIKANAQRSRKDTD